MFDEMWQTVKGFLALFRRGHDLPWTILLPLGLMALTWPVLTILLPSEREAFMVAFVGAMGLRLAMKADGTIRSLQTRISNRRMLILVLLFGPAILAGLIWKGDPLWCQRFLSLYFLLMAALYLLDVVDGRHAMVQYYMPGKRPRGANALMSRVMAIFYMAMLLLNETLIRQVPLTIWLIYFGLLPILLQRLTVALARTVDQAWTKGMGRL